MQQNLKNIKTKIRQCNQTSKKENIILKSKIHVGTEKRNKIKQNYYKIILFIYIILLNIKLFMICL